MKGKTVGFLLILVFATATGIPPVHAGVEEAVSVQPKAPFEPRRVLDLLYMNNPDSALALLRAEQAVAPHDPFVLLLKAKVMRERLNDEDNDKELIRRATEPIHAVIDSAIALSDEALKRDVKDYTQYYNRGYAWLSKAQLYVLTRSYWSAGRAASRGKDDLERYLDRYPDDADARGVLGAYYYFADAIPGFIKFVAKLLLIPSGDREKGLEMIRYAATHDGVFSTDWRFALAAIDLVFEGNFEKGADEFARLLSEYPFYTRLAEPLAVVAPLYPAHTRALRSTAGTAVDVHLTLGEKRIDRALSKRLLLVNAFTDSYFGRPQQAVREYTALIEDPPQHPDWVLPIALLNRGYLLQKAGMEESARKDFEGVRENARSSYYHGAADAMLATIDAPLDTFDLAELDFIVTIYDRAYDEAAAALSRFTEKHGESALSDFYTGDLSALQGDFTGAARAYERALSREARGGDQIYQMFSGARIAELQGASGRFKEAREGLKRAREYTYANYLIRFLLEGRERFYGLVEKGDIEATPNVFVPYRSHDG